MIRRGQGDRFRPTCQSQIRLRRDIRGMCDLFVTARVLAPDTLAMRSRATHSLGCYAAVGIAGQT